MHQNTLTINEPFEDLDYFNLESYKYDGFLGVSNAPVYQFINGDNQLIAIKELKIKDDEDYKRVIDNFKTLQRIKKNKHPNIIQIHGFCKSIKQKAYGEDVSAYLIMEHCEGNLDDYIQMKKKQNIYFSLTEIKKFFSQTLSALQFLQTNLSIAHRDIKPENILVHETNFKIADLDDSKIDLNKTVEKSLVLGTLSFMAPELLKAYNRMKDRLSYNAYRSDVYSLGLCLLYMCTFHKFTRNDRMDGVTNKSKYQEQIKQLRNKVKEKYGSVLSKLLKIMLEIDPVLRPDFETVKKYTIEKAFLEKQDFFSVEANPLQKRDKISINLNKQQVYDGKHQIGMRYSNTIVKNPNCIFSDSDRTTAQYSSDNQETSENSQKRDYFSYQQKYNHAHYFNIDQTHYNNLQSNLPRLHMQKQHSNPNSRPSQIIQTQQKMKPLSNSHSQRESHVQIPNITKIQINSRYSDGNFRQYSKNQYQNPEKLQFEKQRTSLESTNLNQLRKQSSLETTNNGYFGTEQISLSQGCINVQRIPIAYNSQGKIKSSTQINLSNYDSINTVDQLCKAQNRPTIYISNIPEPIQEYNSMKQFDERSNTDRTASNQSNCFYQINHNQNATVNQTEFESRTNSQQSYPNNATISNINNSFYPESQISDSMNVERQNTFTVSEIIRENQNNKIQQQINKNNNQQKQQISNYFDYYNQDEDKYSKVQMNCQQIQHLPSTDKSSNQSSQNIQTQKQQLNQRDINLKDRSNQNTNKQKQDKKKKNQTINNETKVDENENNFYETFLERSSQNPIYQNTINSKTDIDDQHKQSNQKKQNSFQNPDKITKLSKQRKTLAIVIIIMILITIALGLFYFIQMTSNNNDSSSKDNGNSEDNPTTHTVDECKQMNKMYLQGKCYVKCPQQNYYSDFEQKLCIQCDPTCLECIWGEANSCKKCQNDFYLLSLNSSTGMCVSDCPDFFRKDNSINKCIKCPENCLTCTPYTTSEPLNPDTNINPYNANPIYCKKCSNDYFLFGENLCLNVCPKDTTTDYEKRKCLVNPTF